MLRPLESLSYQSPIQVVNTSFVSQSKLVSYFLIYLLLLSLALLVGQRDLNIGTDTQAYFFIYQQIADCSCLIDTLEPGFESLMWLFSTLGMNNSSFLTFFAAAQLLLFFYAGYRLAVSLGYVGNNINKFSVIFLLLIFMSPFFMSVQINIIRQGVSTVLILLAALSFLDKRYLHYMIWSAIAVSIHFTAIMFLILMLGLSIKLKKLLIISVLLFIVYIFGLTREVVVSFSNVFTLPLFEFINNYGAGTDYKGGVRLNFALFSIMPIFIYYGYIFLLPSPKYGLDKLEIALKIYLILLVPFWLFGWANYSDRYALSAWLLMPIFFAVLVFPAFRRLSFGVLFLLLCLTSIVFILNFLKNDVKLFTGF